MAGEFENLGAQPLGLRNPSRLPCPACERCEFDPDLPFGDHRQAALALLLKGQRLSRKAGQFLGQLVVDRSPLSKRQEDWLASLLDQASLPSLANRPAQ